MSDRLARRARRLAALYPRAWRERFGDEFEALLLDDLRDRPRSPDLLADVLAHAALAHLTSAGIAGRGLSAQAQVSRGLRAVGAFVALFVAVAVGIWSDLDVGQSWAPPTSGATRVAFALMSAALLGLLLAAVLAGAIVGCASIRSAWRGSRDERLPLVLGLSCGVLLTLGCAHFASRWPGGRHAFWGEHSLALGAVARFGWAGTQWVTAYWLHPRALSRLPGHLAVWAAISPLLLSGMAVATARATRSLALSPVIARSLVVIGAIAAVLAACFLGATASWVLSAGTGPRELFRAGSVDDVAFVTLALALLAGTHVMRRIAAALPGVPTP